MPKKSDNAPSLEVENEKPETAKEPVSSRPVKDEINSPEEQEEPAAETGSRSDPGSRRRFLWRLAGSFVYIYFALFVVFHAAVGLVFFLNLLNPWTGLLLWLVVMVLGGFSVVALALWREELLTFWD